MESYKLTLYSDLAVEITTLTDKTADTKTVIPTLMNC